MVQRSLLVLYNYFYLIMWGFSYDPDPERSKRVKPSAAIFIVLYYFYLSSQLGLKRYYSQFQTFYKASFDIVEIRRVGNLVSVEIYCVVHRSGMGMVESIEAQSKPNIL